MIIQKAMVMLQLTVPPWLAVSRPHHVVAVLPSASVFPLPLVVHAPVERDVPLPHDAALRYVAVSPPPLSHVSVELVLLAVVSLSPVITT